MGTEVTKILLTVVASLKPIEKEHAENEKTLKAKNFGLRVGLRSELSMEMKSTKIRRQARSSRAGSRKKRLGSSDAGGKTALRADSDIKCHAKDVTKEGNREAGGYK